MNQGNYFIFLTFSLKIYKCVFCIFYRWMMAAQHVDPDEAVKIHLDVKSQKSFAIHWGTLALASEVNTKIYNIYSFRILEIFL